jgi:hypothetical protein
MFDKIDVICNYQSKSIMKEEHLTSRRDFLKTTSTIAITTTAMAALMY